jgi:hypothetical protein
MDEAQVRETKRKLASAISTALSSTATQVDLEGKMDTPVQIFDHEGDDDYVDINYADQGWRIQVQGPFDVD